jgi:hypothetical protein
MRRASLTRFLLIIAMGQVAAGCATATQRAYVAATDRTVTTKLEAAYDGRGQHVVVENRSSQEIVVTSLSLRDCENVKNRCEVTRMRLKVAPNQTTRIATVQVADQERAFNFRYNWTWETASQAAAPR